MLEHEEKSVTVVAFETVVLDIGGKPMIPMPPPPGRGVACAQIKICVNDIHVWDFPSPRILVFETYKQFHQDH